ncbi:MAG: succinate dehydrogenase/fumarate reductase iron-sulfur subunit [Candidatus Marinimicrobia bacterium]|nr:succinate dehydrogenase/fumarate reductase iron-sulfur subunit [Candidatus Neomarinimicrobiota bacterium]
MKVTLQVWRQKNRTTTGDFVSYDVENVSGDMSFFEMLDMLNNSLISEGEDPISFDHDCREGICGTCGVSINGRAHGPLKGVTTCQLHMRSFSDGDVLVVEPWRASAFPVIRDLVVDRTSFDKIMEAGGYVSIKTGGTPDANAIPIPKFDAEEAMDSASCIGCGACVASCKNSSAMLFVGAKVSQFALLPQGKVERKERALNMVATMDDEGFGNCSNTGACEVECPKEISIINIARLNREFFKASFN